MATNPDRPAETRTPAWKLGMVVLLGCLLAIPIFSVYLLISDRYAQSQTARDSIVAGWGDPQTLGGPFLAIPFTRTIAINGVESGRPVRRLEQREERLMIAPEQLAVEVTLAPQLRKRSIYQAVIYEAAVRQRGRFVLPDFAALNIDPATVRLAEAELRVGISSAKGLAGARPRVIAGGRALPLIPGSGLSQTGGSGFAGRLGQAPPAVLPFDIAFALRGHDSISLLPVAQDTAWRVRSTWPHPSFLGGFLPERRQVGDSGFDAGWRIGNLALNRPIVSVGEQEANEADKVTVALIDPVDLYDEVTRATKYGFLFVGFTFVALLMFDLLAGVAVPGPAYLLVGAGLVLFFVLLLALAEVIGFTPAYVVASGAIVALVSAYAAAILRSRRRGGLIGAMLIGLYAVLFALLSLEAYSLLIGALLLFAALAGVMYATRRLDWRGVGRLPG